MDSSRRRAAANVVAGSVWESRIQFDEIRGGIKVFNGDDGIAKCDPPATGGVRRKPWKSDEGFNSILIPVRRSGDEPNQKIPIPVRKLRSNGSPNKPVVGISKPPAKGNGKISPEKIEKESFNVKEDKLTEQKKISQKTFPENKQKLQRFIDLIMWRDFSKSALVFGVGNLFIILSYFIKNVNISFISVISHMALVYLASNFVHKSIFNRILAVFTVPKLITHGEHWLKLCGSSWQLCSHKKGIVFALFFIVWNFSLILYRVWAAFVVSVSFQYYQEC